MNSVFTDRVTYVDMMLQYKRALMQWKSLQTSSCVDLDRPHVLVPLHCPLDWRPIQVLLYLCLMVWAKSAHWLSCVKYDIITIYSQKPLQMRLAGPAGDSPHWKWDSKLKVCLHIPSESYHIHCINMYCTLRYCCAQPSDHPTTNYMELAHWSFRVLYSDFTTLSLCAESHCSRWSVQEEAGSACARSIGKGSR